jgi:hypothetical protein
METASVTLPKDLVEAAIQKEVSAAMLRALGGHEQVMQMAVTRVLEQKVDSDGKPGSYSSNVPFVQWACGNAIRQAVSEAFATEVKKFEGDIRKQLVAALAKKNSPLVKQLVQAMTSGIVEHTENRWRLQITVGER